MKAKYSFFNLRRTITQLIYVYLALLLTVNIATAELTIEITRGNDRALPIAVVPFAWSGNEVFHESLTKIISSDFKLSGRFSTVSQERFQSFPSNANEVFYRDWSLLNTGLSCYR